MPTSTLEEALDFIESMGVTPVAFARVASITGWAREKLETAYEQRYQSWAASRGYDLTPTQE